MPSWIERPVIQACGATILGAVVLWYGLRPMLTGPGTDFPNYYTASRLILEGSDAGQFYNDTWFQARMMEFGFHESGKFSPFPPPTALIMVPLAWMEPISAFRTLTVVNLVALLFCIGTFRSIAQIRWETAALVVMTAGLGVMNNLRFGQFYIFLALLLLLSFRLTRQRKEWQAGTSAGLMIPVKYFPLILVFWFLWERKWKIAGIAIMTAAALTLVSVAVLGTGVFETFFRSVLPSHLQSRYSMQSPWAVAFQSWDSLLMRLFVRDASRNPDVLFDSYVVYLLAKTAVYLAGTGLVVWATARVWRSGDQASHEVLLALIAVAGLLFAPGTATYHFVLLWLPMALLLRHTAGETLIRWTALGCYGVIGWIPYSWLTPFEEVGGATALLVYPRLYLMTILFLVVLVLVHRISSPNTRREAPV